VKIKEEKKNVKSRETKVFLLHFIVRQWVHFFGGRRRRGVEEEYYEFQQGVF
jgi:hypothetical protein